MGQCPAVYELGDDIIAVIGKQASSQVSKKLSKKVGKDEYLVVIDRAMLAKVAVKRA
jgi:hypothetical protein